VVFARGDIEVANVTAQGTASVTLSGVSKAVGAELEGISRLYVDAASGRRHVNWRFWGGRGGHTQLQSSCQVLALCVSR
jgi:hypothetical protein